jgi:arylsulfatase A-like enzyme
MNIPTTNNERRKNVIWIFGDQHRAHALGCSGNPNVRTPNIDILAANGVRFSDAVAGYPLCCPFRGSVLTGKYPQHVVPGHERQMPPEQPTIANVFRDNGYQTAYFGKWHLDGFDSATGGQNYRFHIVPPERRGGFDEWVGYENNNSPWDTWVHGGEGSGAFQYRLPGFETDELSNLMIQYIEKRGKEAAEDTGKPFFAVLSAQPPHDPYAAPEKFMRNYNPANLKLRPNVPDIPRIQEQARRELAGYYAMIENLDWNIGRIREALDRSNLAFGTHIVFFSDHGDMHGSHGQFRKTSPHEESIRVPFIISGEQPYYEGRKTGVSSAFVNHVDVAPTTLGLCGIDKPDWMQGTDYSSHRLAWRKKDDEPDSAYLQNIIPTMHAHSTDKAWRGLVTDDGWKYVCFEGMPWLLFNLNEDPFEQVNLAHNTLYREKIKRLNDRLARWGADTGDDFQLPDYT